MGEVSVRCCFPNRVARAELEIQVREDLGLPEEHVGAWARGHGPAQREDALEEGGRLVPGTTVQGLLGGRLHVTEHESGFAGGQGMVGEAGRGRRPGAECDETLPVPRPSLDHGHPFIGRPPGQLVTEPDQRALDLEDSRGVVDRSLVALIELKTTWLGRDEGYQLLCGRRQARVAREHDVSNVGRHTTRSARQLGDEERVPGCDRVHLDRVEVGSPGQGRDGVGGQWTDLEPCEGLRMPGEVAEKAVQRCADLVGTVGETEHDTAVRDPATEELEQRQRRAIGPMHVLDHDEDGFDAVAQRLQERGVDVPGVRRQIEGRRPGCKVDERPEDTRGVRRIAVAPPALDVGACGAQQGGLTGSGLTFDENDRSAAARGVS
ncbi:MAG: hypothetical protein ABJA89_00520 [Lapillicoccus sp.]